MKAKDVPKRCDKPARWVSPYNGYRECGECYRKHKSAGMELIDWALRPEDKCDRPITKGKNSGR